MTLESSIHRFTHVTRRPFRFERFYGMYDNTIQKMWQASCQFDVQIDIDPKLDEFVRSSIEYRQYIRGGVWFRRGNQAWTGDNAPNGNPKFKIPAYAGQSKVAGIPTTAVSGKGLSLSWKEDGEEEDNVPTERYGYRDTATLIKTNEIDVWSKPNQITGSTYFLRDTPSISQPWFDGQSVEVWIELYFKGFVVEVDRDPVTNITRPTRILKQKEWSYFWPDKKLNLWMDATAI
jgi:hypothetical protein